ncbi:MAG: LLM class F420-dependent oxidoreductase [Alphaproteobacteria bacterium]
MQMGVFFPQLEIGSDPGAIRDFAQTAEDLGYDFIETMDHVMGVNPDSRPGFSGPYTHRSAFREALVLLGFIAGCTRRLGLMTAVLILSQRQTTLVAKQAAELDLLSQGRLRLGIGVGWNRDECESMGMNFRDRGARVEEQIALLRALWTQELVTLDGRWHRVRDAGINPLPVQRPIPIWIGGMADAVLDRIGRLGDGWLPKFPSLDPTLQGRGMKRREESPEALIARVHASARAAGRDPAAIGIEGRVNLGGRTPDEWMRELAAWQALGATHMHVKTMDRGLTPTEQIDLLRRFRDCVGPPDWRP